MLDNTFLAKYRVAAIRPRPDLERVPTRCVGQPEVQADAKVVRMSEGALAHLVDPTALVESMVRRKPQSLRREPQGIEEVALAGTVGTHKDSERRQLYIAGRNALVVAEGYARDHHGRSQVPCLPVTSLETRLFRISHSQGTAGIATRIALDHAFGHVVNML